MKMLLATLFFAFTLTAHAQSLWPRNPTTHKVEFTGVLPWPATAKTEAQRRVLVRRWYLAKLTDSTPAEVEADAATNRTNGLLTYAGLPKVVVVRQGSGDDGILLGYTANFVPSPKGLSYIFSGFDWSRSGDVDATSTPNTLESVIDAEKPEQQAVLAQLHTRLTKALAGWK